MLRFAILVLRPRPKDCRGDVFPYHVVPKRPCSGPRFETPSILRLSGLKNSRFAQEHLGGTCSLTMSSRSVPVRDLVFRSRPETCRDDVPLLMSSRSVPVRDLVFRPRPKGMPTFMSSRSALVRDLVFRPRPTARRGDIPASISSRNNPERGGRCSTR